ncbi:diphthine--ammonia ligase [Pseudalkalibacillus sp. Hm43]|uniref:Dph6-related ATP pyrophosphatase n=1 Tax=Pseudalkalibacillus sp. Hm43 TaxID=3450742 RepID=UPI003F41CA3A
MTKQSVVFWSGGKDCMSALEKMQEKNGEIAYLVTTFDETSRRVPFHGIHIRLIESQAESLQIPLMKIPIPPQASNEEYESILQRALTTLKKQGVEQVVYGDIHLEDLRQYKEALLEPLGLSASFPLWDQSTEDVAKQFLQKGYEALICGINCERIEDEELGELYTVDFLDRYKSRIDPCGENGEFHTFVQDGPLFTKPVQPVIWKKTHTMYDRYKYLELDLDEKTY